MSRTRNIRTARRSLPGGYEGFQQPAARAPQRRAAAATTSSFGRSAMKRGGQGDPMLGAQGAHPEYGVGTVVGVEGEDDDRRVSVSFPGRGDEEVC